MGERIKPVGTVELCIDAGFHCVFCQVRATNAAFIRVCEKAGMALEGRMREHFLRPDGAHIDALIFGIVRLDIKGA